MRIAPGGESLHGVSLEDVPKVLNRLQLMAGRTDQNQRVVSGSIYPGTLAPPAATGELGTPGSFLMLCRLAACGQIANGPMVRSTLRALAFLGRSQAVRQRVLIP